MAFAWVRRQPGVIIPIVGPRKATQLKESLGCLEIDLDEKKMAALDEISRVDLGFPMEFMEREAIRNIRFGGTRDLIDNHRF